MVLIKATVTLNNLKVLILIFLLLIQQEYIE